jgi:hypothetical protein
MTCLIGAPLVKLQLPELGLEGINHSAHAVIAHFHHALGYLLLNPFGLENVVLSLEVLELGVVLL